MKRMLMWIWMLLKRQLKKVSLYVILLCMVASTFFIRHVAVNFSVHISIGVMCEPLEDENPSYDKLITQRIMERMLNHKGLVKFVEYDDEETLKDAVRSSEVYVGYVLLDEFWMRAKEDKLEDGVHVVSTPDSFVSKIANELFFSFVMQEYTYNSLYYNTIASGYFDDEDPEQIAADLREYYEINSTNGSTFGAEFSGVKDTGNTVELDVFDYISPIVEGLIGVMIFLAGLCGTLLLYQDKENGTFSRFSTSQTIGFNVVEISIPTVITSIVGMICLIGTGLYQGTVGQWMHVLMYVVLVVAYCFVLKLFIKKKVAFLASIPVFMMASLLFCNIFMNLGTIVPQFEYISMILPPTYF